MSRLAQIAFNTALAFPPVRAIRDRHADSTGANAAADPEAVMLEWADKIRLAVDRAAGTVVGSDMVEVGPGHSLGVAVALLMEGARSVAALDVTERCDASDPKPFKALAKRWQTSRDKALPQAFPAIMDRLDFGLIQANGRWPFADDAKDIVYSFFAGEHLRNPGQTITETLRVLRPGGLCLYAIDLRNHLDHGGDWLGHLYHSDRTWNAMYSRRGAWTNRLLAPDWSALFEPNFEIVDHEERHLPAPAGFSRDRLAKRFRHFPLEKLLVDYVWFVGRKPD